MAKRQKVGGGGDDGDGLAEVLAMVQTASGTASTCVITLLMLHGRTRLIRIVFSTRLVWFRFFRRPKHAFLPRERQRLRRRRKIKSCCLAHFSFAILLSVFSIVNIILLLFSFYGDVYNIIILASSESIEHGDAKNWINYAQMIDWPCHIYS